MGKDDGKIPGNLLEKFVACRIDSNQLLKLFCYNSFEIYTVQFP